MSNALTKAKIVQELSSKSGLSKKDVGDLLNELCLLAYQEARNSFTIPGIGKLVLVDRKARMGRNPQTGEAIHIPAKKVVKFRISKSCKDAVLGQ
jgi:DNA-binding protein HU-beta